MKCPKCGKEIINDQVTCECGFEMAPKEKTKVKKYLLLGIFMLLAIVIVVSFFVPMKQDGHDYVVANSKDGLYLIDMAIPKKEPVLIKELNGEDDYFYTQISSDNTKLVYSCNNVYDDESQIELYELYVYDILEGTSTLIDSDVYSYITNGSFDTFTYFKGTDNELWQCKTGEKPKKLLDKVFDVKVSSDLSKLFYTDTDRSLYVMLAGEEPELISEDVDVVSYGDNKVLYNDNGKLIKYENKEKTVINDNFYMSSYMTADGGYFFANARGFELEKYFTDDMMESDKRISIDDIEAYSDKLQRDELRLDFAAKLQSEVGDIYSLYYFDGDKATLVRDNVIDILLNEAASLYGASDSVISYKYLDSYEMPKLTMSEFYEEAPDNTYYTIYDEFYSRIEEQSHLAFARCDKELGEVCVDDVTAYAYCAETKTAYLHTLDYTDEENYEYISKYYLVTLGDNGVTEPEVYVEDASSDPGSFVGNSFIYFKEKDDTILIDVYLDKKLIIEDATAFCWLSDSVFSIEKYDENGNKTDMILNSSGLFTVKGVEDLDLKEVTSHGSIFCYSYEKSGAAVIKNGIVTPLSTDIEFAGYNIPRLIDSYFELSGPFD